MSDIATSLSQTCGREHAFQPRDGTSISRLTQVQAETHTSADIAFVTAEGDKVTLSTDAVVQAAYTSYDARGRLQGHGIDGHAETFQLGSARDVTLQIEGDLNDAERADIQQALRTIEKLATDFFSGQLDEPLKQVGDLGALHTLRSIDATLEFSQSLTVSQLTETRASADATSVRAPHAAAPEAKPSATQSPQNLLEALLHTVDASTVNPAKLAGEAPKFFAKLSEKLAARPDFGTSQHHLFHQIAAQFLQQLQNGGNVNTPATTDNGQVVQPEELGAAHA